MSLLRAGSIIRIPLVAIPSFSAVSLTRLRSPRRNGTPIFRVTICRAACNTRGSVPSVNTNRLGWVCSLPIKVSIKFIGKSYIANESAGRPEGSYIGSVDHKGRVVMLGTGKLESCRSLSMLGMRLGAKCLARRASLPVN